MKPNFALGLTDDGVTLWQRGAVGWLRVGAVALDADDMDGQVQHLVKTAKLLEPGGIATKLVIPDDQILYTQLDVDPKDRAIRDALQGKTPYPVDDLVFDWVKQDGRVLVAVVARETLAEAEDFATAQGLNPVCYVASSVGPGFAHAPFFGVVAGVQTDPALLQGDAVIKEVGKAELPKPPKAPAPTPAAPEKPVAKGPDVPAPVTKPDTARVEPTPSAAPTKAAAVPPTPAAPKAAPADSSVAFRSRRGAGAPPPPAPAAPNQTLKALSKTRSLSLGALGGAALAERLRASVAAPVTRAGSNLRTASDLLGRKLAPATKPKPAETPTSQAAAPKPAAPGKAPPAAPSPAKRPEADPEAERLTVFGARRQNKTPDAALPKRALLISGAALLLVIAVGMWVFYFTRMQVPDIAQPILPDEAALDIAVPEALTLPDPTEQTTTEVEAALGQTDAAQNRGAVTAPEAEGDTPDAVATQSDAPSVASPLQDAGRLASLRSVRAIAPESPSTLPLFQGPPAPFGATPLPPLRGAPAADAPEEAAQPPASTLPPGEEQLEIVVTPGRPNVAPPVRPEGIAPEPAPTPEPASQAAAPATAADPLDESALVIDVNEGNPPIVPPARPEEIAPETALPTDTPPTDDEGDQASLAPPPGGVALTMLSPAARPAQITDQASATAERFASATPQAVAASLRPSGRPTQFAQTVQRALAAARTRDSAQPEAEIIQASAASAAPRIPSSASVSRAATQARAINLRQINLLGVMGTPSARRALVRLDNGRVVTVAVGERLDGGQVTAIGDSELRYNRRGRDVVLRLAS
jgi:hypothetical protein